MANANETDTTSRPDLGFGAELRAAREAAGISLGDMAVRCRLSVPQLKAIEAEDMASLPEPVYVRAFIRGYAKALELDGDRLQADYNARYGHSGANVGQIPDADPRDEYVISARPGRRGVKVAAVAAALAVAVAGVAYYFNRDLAENAAGSVDEKPSAELTDPSALSAEQKSAPNAARAESPAEIPTASQAPAPEVPAEKTTEGPEALPQHLVSFRTSGPCWVQVIGPKGEQIVAREMKAGEEHAVTVPLGSSFTIGNSPVMQLSVDGISYDFASTVRNGVARFALK